MALLIAGALFMASTELAVPQREIVNLRRRVVDLNIAGRLALSLPCVDGASSNAPLVVTVLL
jgi:hypothetical protein